MFLSDPSSRPGARTVSKVACLLAAVLLLPLLPVWSAGGNDEHEDTPRPTMPATTATTPPAANPGPEVAQANTVVPTTRPEDLVHPVERVVGESVEFTGWVEPVQTVVLTPRVSGAVTNVEFEAGSIVKRGDLLFVLDAREYQVELDKANAERERAQTRIERENIAVENIEKLAKDGRMSRQTVRDVTGDLQEALADERAARASWERARLNLEMTRVTAPIDGRIGAALSTEGNVAVADKTHLATIVALDPVYVAFQVVEREALRIRRLARAGTLPGATRSAVPAAMELADETGFPRAGKVLCLETAFDAASGTTQWCALFPNEDLHLLPGLRARVRIVTGEPHTALLIPRAAVAEDESGSYVSVALGSGDTFETRPVQLGQTHDDLVVVREGRLTPADRICVRAAKVR